MNKQQHKIQKDNCRSVDEILSNASCLIKTIDENSEQLTKLIKSIEEGRITAFSSRQDDEEREHFIQTVKNMRDDVETLAAWKKQIEEIIYIIETALHPDVTSESQLECTKRKIESSPDLKKLKELVASLPVLKTNF